MYSGIVACRLYVECMSFFYNMSVDTCFIKREKSQKNGSHNVAMGDPIAQVTELQRKWLGT